MAPEPGPLSAKLAAVARALPTVNAAAVAISVLAIGIAGLCRKFRPNWPGMPIAVLLASVLWLVLDLPVDTIGSRFGGIPQTLPAPALPILS